MVTAKVALPSLSSTGPVRSALLRPGWLEPRVQRGMVTNEPAGFAAHRRVVVSDFTAQVAMFHCPQHCLGVPILAAPYLASRAGCLDHPPNGIFIRRSQNTLLELPAPRPVVTGAHSQRCRPAFAGTQALIRGWRQTHCCVRGVRQAFAQVAVAHLIISSPDTEVWQPIPS